MKGQAICKDCGNATLNNKLVERFIETNDGYGDYVICKQCGGTHIDGELYTEAE